MIQLLVTIFNHQTIKGTRMDIPTRKSIALKTAREFRDAGTTNDNMSSSAHVKYKIPSAASSTCAHLSTLDETIRLSNIFRILACPVPSTSK
jgi:hypothetical protein